MTMIRRLVFATLVLAASGAYADKQQGTACAGSLDAESKTIYDAVAPEVTASTNLRDVVTSSTRSLVMKGQVNRSTAKASAEAAGACLEKLKS
jgi:hypothetical protein